MARMIDIAERAGVSLKTVSRVLNNEPHVKEEVRDRVRRAAEDVGYVPSTSARRLAGSRNYAIQLISHSSRSNYVNAIQFGAVQACQSLGYQLIVSLLAGADKMDWAELYKNAEILVKTARPDGIILVPPLSNDGRLAEVLQQLGVPVARVDPRAIDGSTIVVRINERQAACELVEYLLQQGHTRIAFIRGKEDQNATHERFAGYQDALKAANIDLDPSLVLPGTFDFPSGLSGGEHLMRLDDAPTAIFAANDDMAAGVLMAALRNGVSVPKDLSIVGFDDADVADKTWPALTTVRQPLLEIGEAAASELIRLVSNNGPVRAETLNRVLDHEIVYRSSADAPPIAS